MKSLTEKRGASLGREISKSTKNGEKGRGVRMKGRKKGEGGGAL